MAHAFRKGMRALFGRSGTRERFVRRIGIQFGSMQGTLASSMKVLLCITRPIDAADSYAYATAVLDRFS